MSQTVLGEYFLDRDRAVVFVLRPDAEEPEAFELALSAHELRTWVMERFSPGGEPLLDLADDELGAFAAPLVAPLVQRSEPGDTLWLVPHDALHHVPLHAAVVDGAPLVQRNPVCYTPSAAVMRHCQANRTGRRERALVLGDSRDDLLHARDEAVRVADRFGTTAICGREATKARLLERLQEPVDVLHFSCHGYFDPEDPMESGIVLAENGDDEPNLTADEILDLQLQADLVTVTACESGVSDRRAGDELIGLARALLFAGTPSVLVTRWRVDDLSTTLVSERFYAALLDGALTKAEALREAQLHVRGLSARAVIDYCDGRAEALAHDAPVRLIVRADRARTIAAADDIGAAVTAFTQLAAEAAAVGGAVGEAVAREAVDALALLALRAELPWVADYDRAPFADPYHWAAMTLVGYWR